MKAQKCIGNISDLTGPPLLSDVIDDQEKRISNLEVKVFGEAGFSEGYAIDRINKNGERLNILEDYGEGE